jgi:RNA polymerase sigma-70 factor (ECF subfamily)
MEELVNKYQQWVYTLAYRTLRNPDAADDVTQETFIRAYRSIQSYYPQRGHRFSGWLYRITVNLSLNQLKKQKKDKFRFWSHKTEPEKRNRRPPSGDTSVPGPLPGGCCPD